MQSYNGFGMPRPKDNAKNTRLKLIYINKNIDENLLSTHFRKIKIKHIFDF